MTSVRNKLQIKLHNCPDAIIAGAGNNQIFVGMYELIEGQRTGGLVALSADDFTVKSHILSEVGVLDIKHTHGSILAACSDGTVKTIKSDGSCSSISVTTEKGMKGVVMAVTGDFASPCVASITTAGELQLSDLESGESVWGIQAHSKDWESWFVASNGDSLVVTGSDDRSFRLFDVNCGTQIFSSKFHESGVTWLEFERDREFSLITGSYDERMAFWDTRNLSAGPVRTWKLEGGVWRTRRLPGDDRFLVAMCYGGFGVFDSGRKVFGSEDLALCYGVDLLPSDGGLVALDFYEKTVSLYSMSV
jgi:WD40 repeat protein